MWNRLSENVKYSNRLSEIVCIAHAHVTHAQGGTGVHIRARPRVTIHARARDTIPRLNSLILLLHVTSTRLNDQDYTCTRM